MPPSLGETCTAVMIAIAVQQQEPLRTEMLTILLEDGHITAQQFAEIAGRIAA